MAEFKCKSLSQSTWAIILLSLSFLFVFGFGFGIAWSIQYFVKSPQKKKKKKTLHNSHGMTGRSLIIKSDP